MSNGPQPQPGVVLGGNVPSVHGRPGTYGLDNVPEQSTVPANPQPPYPHHRNCPPGTELILGACLPIPTGAAPTGGGAPAASPGGTVVYDPWGIGPKEPADDAPAGTTSTGSGSQVVPPPFPWLALVAGLSAVFLLGRK